MNPHLSSTHLSQRDPDGASATTHVQQHARAVYISVIADLLIQLLGGRRVYLCKRRVVRITTQSSTLFGSNNNRRINSIITDAITWLVSIIGTEYYGKCKGSLPERRPEVIS